MNTGCSLSYVIIYLILQSLEILTALDIPNVATLSMSIERFIFSKVVRILLYSSLYVALKGK